MYLLFNLEFYFILNELLVNYLFILFPQYTIIFENLISKTTGNKSKHIERHLCLRIDISGNITLTVFVFTTNHQSDSNKFITL